MLRSHDRATTAQEVRACFKSTPQWAESRAALKAGHPPCHICGLEIDYTLQYPHPMSFQADHLDGYRVEQQIGKMKWEIKRICCDLAGLRASHMRCNAKDNRGRGVVWYEPTPKATPEAEPLVLKEFVNQRTHEHEKFYVNDRTVLGADWIEVAA
jgi:hypothetical protein